jgi:hypothetical protein
LGCCRGGDGSVVKRFAENVNPASKHQQRL